MHVFDLTCIAAKTKCVFIPQSCVCVSRKTIYIYTSASFYDCMRQVSADSMVAVCLLLFGTQGTNSENLCLMFVHVCFILCLHRDWSCGLTGEKDM